MRKLTRWEWVKAAIWAALIMAVSAYSLISTEAIGHEAMTGWSYPKDCCSDKDCTTIKSDRVQITPDGYHLDHLFVIPFSEARQSPDDNYHACFYRYNSKLIRAYKLPCFWAPRGIS